MKTYDELLAERDGLKYHLARVLDAYGGNSGFEPSLSVFLRAIDEAKKSFDESPQQYLSSIRAEAGRAGFVAGFAESDSWVNGECGLSDGSVFKMADEYAAKVRQGGE